MIERIGEWKFWTERLVINKKAAMQSGAFVI